MKQLLLVVLLLVGIIACVPTEGDEPIAINPTRPAKETATPGLPSPFPDFTPTYPPEWATATAEMALTLTPFISAIDQTSVAATATGAAVMQVTPGFIPSPTPVPPFPGIVYANSTGTWQVGTNWRPVLLTNHPIITLSPDGQQLVYEENNDIWLVDRQTGEEKNLTTYDDTPFSRPQWWPAALNLLIVSSWSQNDTEPGREGLLTILDLDGVYQILNDRQQYTSPSPSPTTLQIAYNPDGQAALYDLQSGQTTLLQSADFGLPPDLLLSNPAWSPTGEQIAWSVVETETGTEGTAVVILNLETQTGRLFDTATQTGGVFHPFDTPAWSPDGRFLAYLSTNPDPLLDGVWVINTQDGNMTFVGDIARPVWSPDGRFLVLSPMGYDSIGNTALIETDSWYPLQMYIPDGGIVIDWR